MYGSDHLLVEQGLLWFEKALPALLTTVVCGTMREKVDGHHAHSCQSGSQGLEARSRFQCTNFSPGRQRSGHLTPKTGEKWKDFSLKEFIWKR